MDPSITVCIIGSFTTLFLAFVACSAVALENFYLYIRTGTFPLRERAIQRIVALNEQRLRRRDEGTISTTILGTPQLIPIQEELITKRIPHDDVENDICS